MGKDSPVVGRRPVLGRKPVHQARDAGLAITEMLRIDGALFRSRRSERRLVGRLRRRRGRSS